MKSPLSSTDGRLIKFRKNIFILYYFREQSSRFGMNCISNNIGSSVPQKKMNSLFWLGAKLNSILDHLNWILVLIISNLYDQNQVVLSICSFTLWHAGSQDKTVVVLIFVVSNGLLFALIQKGSNICTLWIQGRLISTTSGPVFRFSLLVC